MTMQNLIMAYLGDAAYELYVREYLINKGISNVNDLQKESLKYVSATSQKNILEELINNNILTFIFPYSFLLYNIPQIDNFFKHFLYY